MGADFFIAAFLLLDRIAPADKPWRTPQGRWGRAWRSGIWALGTPLLMLGGLIDQLVHQFRFIPGVSNAYRVLARVAEAKAQAPQRLSA